MLLSSLAQEEELLSTSSLSSKASNRGSSGRLEEPSTIRARPAGRCRETRGTCRRTMWACVNPPDVILVLSNVIFFMLAAFCFFWFIASRHLEEVIAEKIHLVTDVAEFNQLVAKLVRDWIASMKADGTFERGYMQRKQRDVYNMEIAKNVVMCYIGIAMAVVGSCFLYMASNRRIHLWKRDHTCLFILVIAAFLAEIVFYFAIIKRWKTISDAEVIGAAFRYFVTNELLFLHLGSEQS